jgi:HAD superfamily hydrolase (TIGR01509 family)
MFQQAINHYLQAHGYPYIKLKAVLFDMDGVLFDSLPYHAEAWSQTIKAHGLDFSPEEVYLHEGRTGTDTINFIYERQWGREATPEELEILYQEKIAKFNKYPPAKRFPGTCELLSNIKAAGIISSVVTGSGQDSLLGQLEESYPGMFCHERMVTAFDVKHGKPTPEPYLTALAKGNLKAHEAIVVENAPLGVQAGVGAGIFTVAVNTGPLADSVLTDAGANLLFPSMQALADAWEELYAALEATASYLP